MKTARWMLSVVLVICLVSCTKQKSFKIPLHEEIRDSLSANERFGCRIEYIKVKGIGEKFDPNKIKVFESSNGYALIAGSRIIYLNKEGIKTKEISIYDNIKSEVAKMIPNLDSLIIQKIAFGFLSCSDRNFNLYLLENLTGLILTYNPNGELINKIQARDYQQVRDICVNHNGLVFLHKIPTLKDYFFVNVYNSKGYLKSLVQADKKYDGYYLTEAPLYGGLVSMDNGNIIECNTYSCMINRISSDLNVSTFGQPETFYSDLKPARINEMKNEDVVKSGKEHSFCRVFVNYDGSNKIVRIFYKLFADDKGIDTFYQLYDSSGNHISSGKYEGKLLHSIVYDRLVRLEYDWDTPANDKGYKIIKYTYKQ